MHATESNRERVFVRAVFTACSVLPIASAVTLLLYCFNRRCYLRHVLNPTNHYEILHACSSSYSFYERTTIILFLPAVLASIFLVIGTAIYAYQSERRIPRFFSVLWIGSASLFPILFLFDPGGCVGLIFKGF